MFWIAVAMGDGWKKGRRESEVWWKHTFRPSCVSFDSPTLISLPNTPLSTAFNPDVDIFKSRAIRALEGRHKTPIGEAASFREAACSASS